jgi:DNA polymerase III delta prime subunit
MKLKEKTKEGMLWYTKYRPQTIEQCILPEELKQLFTNIVKNNNVPNMLFSGPPGIGKTTVAKAIVNELDMDMLFMNCSKDSSVDEVRVSIDRFTNSMSLRNRHKVFVGDEFDYFSPNGQAALRGVIESVSNNCRFILTCNYANKIIKEIREGRVEVIHFRIKKADRPNVAGQFMKRCCEILDEEGLKYDKKVLAALVGKQFPNFRKILSMLQRASITRGEITPEILNDVDSDITGYVVALKNRDFKTARTFITESAVEPADLFSGLYKTLNDVFDEDSIALAIKLLNDYQYKNAFVADPDLNLASLTVELMGQCNFK